METTAETLKNQVDTNETIIKENLEEIKKIHKDCVIVNEMMTQLNEIIKEQEVPITKAAKTINESKHNVQYTKNMLDDMNAESSCRIS